MTWLIHTHPFNGPFSGTTQVSRYQKGKTNLDLTEARDSEWQWHQLRHMQVCTSLQTDNHASTTPLSFLQAGCPSCRPTNSIKALKAIITWLILTNKTVQENTDKQTQYKSEKVNNRKYSKTKLAWFSCLVQHSAKKRGGLILQRSRAYTGRINR